MTPTLLVVLALQGAVGGPISTAGAPPPPPVSAPAAPSAAAPPAPSSPSAAIPPVAKGAAPRRIDDKAHLLTGMVPQGSYEEEVKGAFSRTQSLQGPLDGTWTLKDAAGAALYRVQLVDPGYAGARLEGAWSDLRTGAAATSGFFTSVVRDGDKLSLQFAEPGAGLVSVNLDAGAGGFTGQISRGEAGKDAKTATVSLVRP